MMPTTESLFCDAKKLPADQRVELANRLLESVSIANSELNAELDRRWAEQLANPNDMLSWEEVRDAALNHLKTNQNSDVTLRDEIRVIPASSEDAPFYILTDWAVSAGSMSNAEIDRELYRD